MANSYVRIFVLGFHALFVVTQACYADMRCSLDQASTALNASSCDHSQLSVSSSLSCVSVSDISDQIRFECCLSNSPSTAGQECHLISYGSGIYDVICGTSTAGACYLKLSPMV